MQSVFDIRCVEC